MLVQHGDNIVFGEATDDKGIELPTYVWKTLNERYPAYSWHVSEQGGMLVIKELALAAIYGPYCMAYPVHKIQSYARFKRELLFMAGELLERAKLPRGAWNGERPALEGTDPRFLRAGQSK